MKKTETLPITEYVRSTSEIITYNKSTQIPSKDIFVYNNPESCEILHTTYYNSYWIKLEEYFKIVTKDISKTNFLGDVTVIEHIESVAK